jgi:hypothetical protein
MRWFGASGGVFERDCEKAETPVGDPCAWCEEPIVDGDSGLLMPDYSSPDHAERPYHNECQLRMAMGGVNHIMRRCRCQRCGGFLAPDDPWLTRRQAASEAVRLWWRQALEEEVRRRRER